MENYNRLVEQVKGKNELEDFENVNKCLDSILMNYTEEGKVKCVQALICDIEARQGNDNEWSVLAICVAYIIGGATLLANIDMQSGAVIGVLLVFAAIVPLLISFFEYVLAKLGRVRGKKIKKDIFVLKILQIRLNKLIGK